MDMVKDLQKLISIPSIAEAKGPEGTPFGAEVDKALRFVLDLCRSLGFRTKNCDGHIGWAEIGEGEDIVGILAHLDVVPPGSGWTYPPFSGELHDGKIYGRGTVDDKGPAIACIYAMKDLLESGVKLNKRVRIIFGMTEEDGDWLDMEYYKTHEEIPSMGFTPDADFPAIYGEKGILQVELKMQEKDSSIIAIQGGEAPNMVPDNCSIRLAGLEGSDEIAILKTGVSAHGSTPWDGENALSKAMKAAYDLERAGKISSPFIRFYMEKIGFAIYGENINLGIEDKESGKLTFNAGTVKMADEGMITLTADIRYPVTFHLDEVLARLKEGIKPYPVEVKNLAHIKPVYMNKDGQLIKTLMSAYRDITGDESEALVIGGGTYARAMDNIVAFGPLFSHREPTEHKKDEHIYVEDLVKIRRIYGLAIERLATGSIKI